MYLYQVRYPRHDKPAFWALRIEVDMTESADGSKTEGPRIGREKRTVEKMIRFHCERKHKTISGSLCEDCADILTYSMQRLNHCQFGEEKPTCRKCTVHCYSPTMREKIRQVMRFSGPRLAIRMPLDWIRHAFDEKE